MLSAPDIVLFMIVIPGIFGGIVDGVFGGLIGENGAGTPILGGFFMLLTYVYIRFCERIEKRQSDQD